jgi:membrane fusion protein, multidrug efflux system
VDQTLAALGGKSFDPSRLYQHPNIMKLRKELEQAELKLSYTEIRAPVTGVVNRKSVNPGDHVQASQALMSIQPLDSVYIVANFKENQLSDILIGQPVEIFVDAYPGPPLKGRVSGFAAATGAASSLLPAENATGNFVKVVQRLPVRIDLAEANPRKTPLLVGMSVIPLVDIKAMPTGPDAGERLRSPEAVRAAASVKEASATKEVMR